VSPLSNLLNRGSKPKAGQLYGTAVAHARQPAFYSQIGVDDTPDGRFAMISLHILLILERLSAPGDRRDLEDMTQQRAKNAGSTNQNADRDPGLGRELMEVFVEDLDQSMRELGIGDMGVPKRAKKAMAQFYDYARRYRDLRNDGGAGSDAMHVLLSDMIPGLTKDSTGMTPLAKYVCTSDKMLAEAVVDKIAVGAVEFPDIAAMTAGSTREPDNGAMS